MPEGIRPVNLVHMYVCERYSPIHRYIAMSSTPALADLLKAVEQLRKYPFEDAAERRRAMLLTREVSDELQLPYDKIMEMWGGVRRELAA